MLEVRNVPMKLYVLRNVSNGSILATRVARATNFITRGIGLLGRAVVEPDEGLWIDHCSGGVHTMFMRATIDLYFLDRNDTVLKIAAAVPPNRLAITCRNSVTVVELGAGPELGRDVLVGDRLALDVADA